MILIFISVWLSGCQMEKQSELDTPWQYSDIRALDAADVTDPGSDILAVYLRQSSSNSITEDLQIRLDFLDLSFLPESDIYIAFDTQQGGSEQIAPSLPTDIAWDVLLVISASLQIRLYNSQFSPLTATGISVYRDPLQDTLTINLSNKTFQHVLSKFNFQVFTISPGAERFADSTNGISSIDFPPHQAEALLAFWNTFPALTPAQALRRWDGAHTGPKGNRHGLYNLLSKADSHAIPLFLLDLKYPSSLSALDYVGGMDLVRDMLDKKLVMLPDPQPILSYSNPVLLPNEILDQEISFIRTNETAFKLPASKASFSLTAPFTDVNGISRYSIIFLIQSPQSSLISPYPEIKISSCAGQSIVPITIFPYPDPFYDQTDLEGPTLPLRRALINNAIQNNQLNSTEPLMMTLGGELPNSSWGIPDEAEATFDYFDNHPWIHIVGENDLILSSGSKTTNCPGRTEAKDLKLNPHAMDTMKTSPKNMAFTHAIETITSLTTPIFPDSSVLMELRQNYLRQVDTLLEVARWAEIPYTRSDCNKDIDNDGQSDCILSTDRYFLVINPKNGGLLYAFFINRGILHQLMGPSSLLATGLSSPETWNYSAAEFSDPTVIPGAFWGEEKSYQIDTSRDAIIFTSPSGIKSYALSPLGINITVTEPTNTSYQIPFIIDPWMRFTPHWIDHYVSIAKKEGNNIFSWEYPDGSSVSLDVNHPLTITSFANSYEYMNKTENPDIDFPAGHFLPMPLILGEIRYFTPPLMINLTVR